jgi:hypothetical protein
MSGTFDFCPNSLVPETLPPDSPAVVSLNGWTFSSKPSIPYQKRFKVTLHGLRWHLQSNGLFDVTTNPTINARRLEQFYETNGIWDKFAWTHPHFGLLNVRFSSPVIVPMGIENSNGLIPAFEINLIHADPAYT